MERFPALHPRPAGSNRPAAEMGVSLHTVIFHIKNIRQKLHVHSNSEAVARALREGWIR